jgi:hypothetical protein
VPVELLWVDKNLLGVEFLGVVFLIVFHSWFVLEPWVVCLAA